MLDAPPPPVIDPLLEQARELRIDVASVIDESIADLESKSDKSTINDPKQAFFLKELKQKPKEKSFAEHINDLLNKHSLNEAHCRNEVKDIIQKLRDVSALESKALATTTANTVPLTSGWALFFTVSADKLSDSLKQNIYLLHEYIQDHRDEKWTKLTDMEFLTFCVIKAIHAANETTTNNINAIAEEFAKLNYLHSGTMRETLINIALQFQKMPGKPMEKQNLIMDWLTEITNKIDPQARAVKK